jgi:DNA-binding MarR family transcriptional regulator
MNDSLCLCALLKSVAGSCERALNDVAMTLGVSHCQATVLVHLSQGPKMMSALGRELCCHKSNVTQVVDGLVKKKLVKRAHSATDRRIHTLTLTTQGATIARKALRILDKRASAALTCLSATECRTLQTILTRLLEHQRDGGRD